MSPGCFANAQFAKNAGFAAVSASSVGLRFASLTSASR
jgi:hypothetical protein